MSVRNGKEVISDNEFDKLHKQSKEQTITLFQQLLFGLAEVYQPGLIQLQVTLYRALPIITLIFSFF